MDIDKHATNLQAHNKLKNSLLSAMYVRSLLTCKPTANYTPHNYVHETWHTRSLLGNEVFVGQYKLPSPQPNEILTTRYHAGSLPLNEALTGSMKSSQLRVRNLPYTLPTNANSMLAPEAHHHLREFDSAFDMVPHVRVRYIDLLNASATIVLRRVWAPPVGNRTNNT